MKQPSHTDIAELILEYNSSRIVFAEEEEEEEEARLVVSLKDITERKRAEQLLGWEKSALELMARTASLSEVLDGLMLGLEKQAPGTLCSVLLLDADGVHLRHGAAPSLPPAYNRLIDGIAIGPQVGSCGTAAHANRQVIVADIGSDPLWADYRDLALGHGLRACWSTPIHSGQGKILGTFAIYCRAPRHPAPAELELIERATHIAGIAIERKAAEAQIHEQAALLDRARDAIIATDLDCRIAYWNASAERIYGWDATEALGRSLHELNLGYAPTRFAAARAQVLAAGEWRGDFNLQTKRGELLQVESTWSLVRDATGHPRSILLIDTDVTDKKKLESQLLRADRMDSIGMLAGGVAHDLNNVLSPILMGAQLLRLRALEARDLRILENIERSAHHGSALVRQLLTFARGGEGERAEVQITNLIEDVRKLLQQSLPRTIELGIDCAGATHPILADATQIKQLLLNLALNARDAMPQGGRLDLRAADTLVGESLARLHPGAQAGPHVRISVSDTGTGIPPALLAKIFDPFFTTKGIGKGTGLGLSTVLGIVKNHGGFLDVESAVGRGTEFHLFFPALRQAAAATARSASPFANVGHGELVLVVDDDATMCDTLQLVLERSGYRVVTAHDGPAALAEFDRQPDEVAAVITDIRMPGMLGPELIAAVRSRRPQQRILAMSGLLDPKQKETLQALQPPVEFLAKPILSETLLGALQRVLAGSGEPSSPPGPAVKPTSS